MLESENTEHLMPTSSFCSELRRLSPQFSTASEFFREHKENLTPIANLDERVLMDVSTDENYQGTCRNGNYAPLVPPRQNRVAESFQLEDGSHGPFSFHRKPVKMRATHIWVQKISCCDAYLGGVMSMLFP